MVDKFTLQWDIARPILRETLGPGIWTQTDDESYMAALTTRLRSAPPGGFDFASDAQDYTMQSERPNDEEIYELMARSGCRRLIQAGSKSVLSRQTARVLRSSTAHGMAHIMCATMDDAETLLR